MVLGLLGYVVAQGAGPPVNIMGFKGPEALLGGIIFQVKGQIPFITGPSLGLQVKGI